MQMLTNSLHHYLPVVKRSASRGSWVVWHLRWSMRCISRCPGVPAEQRGPERNSYALPQWQPHQSCTAQQQPQLCSAAVHAVSRATHPPCESLGPALNELLGIPWYAAQASATIDMSIIDACLPDLKTCGASPQRCSLPDVCASLHNRLRKATISKELLMKPLPHEAHASSILRK